MNVNTRRRTSLYDLGFSSLHPIQSLTTNVKLQDDLVKKHQTLFGKKSKRRRTAEELSNGVQYSEEELHQALKQAIQDGSLQGVEEALALGADLDAVHFEDNMTPLLKSIQSGNYLLFELLLSKRVDPHLSDAKYRNAFYFACFGTSIKSGEHSKFVARLLAYFESRKEGIKGEHVLMGAFASHHKGVTEAVLEKIACKILSKDSNGLCKVRVEQLELLDSPCLRLRWPDGSFSPYGRTPLHMLLLKRNTLALVHPVCLALMNWKWDAYGKRFFLREAVLYFSQILCVTCVTYLSTYDVLVEGNGTGNLEDYDFGNPISVLRFCLEVLAIIMAILIFFTSVQFVGLRTNKHLTGRKRTSNFKEPLSAVFPTLLAQSLLLLVAILRLGAAAARPQLVALAVSNILQFERYIHIMSLTQAFGPFFIMLVEMFQRDIVPFALILIALFVPFGAAIGLLTSHGFMEDSTTVAYRTPISSALELFFGLVGTDGFNIVRGDWMRAGQSDLLVIVFIVVYTVVGPILAINLLVAMMANTYSAINQNSVAEWAYRRFRYLCVRESFVNEPYFGHRVLKDVFCNAKGKCYVDKESAVHPGDVNDLGESEVPAFEKCTDSCASGYQFEGLFKDFFEPFQSQSDRQRDRTEDLSEMLVSLLVQNHEMATQIERVASLHT